MPILLKNTLLVLVSVVLCTAAAEGLVRWLDADKSPTRCNLSYQGRVPAWMRGVLPDNAASIQDKGRH